jgi:hypothetical protein
VRLVHLHRFRGGVGPARQRDHVKKKRCVGAPETTRKWSLSLLGVERLGLWLALGIFLAERFFFSAGGAWLLPLRI